jgi:co-chaperonin GroES (HSP10)
MRAKLREVAARSGDDPKQAIMSQLHNIDEIEVFHNQVLVATYIQPEKTTGGVFLPDRTLQEDRFQGKCALVLKVGPLAFKDDKIAKFGGVKIEPGDWVIARPSDGWELYAAEHTKAGASGVCCRIFEDINIKGRVSDPTLIY